MLQSQALAKVLILLILQIFVKSTEKKGFLFVSDDVFVSLSKW